MTEIIYHKLISTNNSENDIVYTEVYPLVYETITNYAGNIHN